MSSSDCIIYSSRLDFLNQQLLLPVFFPTANPVRRFSFFFSFLVGNKGLGDVQHAFTHIFIFFCSCTARFATAIVAILEQCLGRLTESTSAIFPCDYYRLLLKIQSASKYKQVDRMGNLILYLGLKISKIIFNGDARP